MTTTEDRSIWDIAAEYISLDRNPADLRTVEQWIIEKDTTSMKKYLSHRMPFGTAGLRAEMGPGYSRMNDLTIIQTTQGLCSYLMSKINASFIG
jgi:hypothetical protein